MLQRMARILTLGIAVLSTVLLVTQSASTEPGRPLFSWEFVETAPQGFGDRQNSGTWSMKWWRGKLYVGTVRAWFCFSQAWFNKMSPLVPYPPIDPDFDCAPDPLDLPLQAEIWRYTPETKTWERVYQAPNDVELPGHPGRYMGRDMGYRSMAVFQEPDGTEALYVGGTTPYALWPGFPPPRILRSTDGITFEPIPQATGTVLGDLGQDQSTFRSMEVYKGRLYVINGKIQGQGPVLEAENPAGGNDNFRWITPQGMLVFELAPFNGLLYVGSSERVKGYSVLKTDATGSPPYTFTPVVTDGGFRQGLRSPSVVSMHVFDGSLYVGTDQPAEVIRINPDDTWDLIVGTPRETPDGWKYPLSGLDAGFNWPFTQHMWRMQDHEGVLYIGTNDTTTRIGKLLPWREKNFAWQEGFDLYGTPDGHYLRPVTVNGFGDRFQIGVRAFASTPYGLFVGTVSFWYGLRILQGTPGEVYTAYFPLLVNLSRVAGLGKESSTSPAVVPDFSRPSRFLEPPERLEVESKDGVVVLSWERPRGAIRFRIFRSDFTSNRELGISDLDLDTWVPGPFAEIGRTDQFFYVDTTVRAGRPAQYYVLAEDAAGNVSQPSNLVRAPSLAPGVTFRSLTKTLDDWQAPRKLKSDDTTKAVAQALEEAQDDVDSGDAGRALRRLEQLRQRIQAGQPAVLEPWRARDLEILLAKLARRVRLVQAGLLSTSELN